MFRFILVFALLLHPATAPTVDSTRAGEHWRQRRALGCRRAGSAAIEQSRTYIKSQLAAIGVPVTEQAWDDQTPTGRVHMVTLIASTPGTSKNRLVIGGH